MKEERLFISKNHFVEGSKVGGGANSFQAPQFFQVGGLFNLSQQAVDLSGSDSQFFAVHPQAVVPAGALDTPAGIEQLSENHGAADLTALDWIVRSPVLRPAEQNVSVPLPTYPRQEFSSGIAKRKSDLPFRTGAH